MNNAKRTCKMPFSPVPGALGHPAVFIVLVARCSCKWHVLCMCTMTHNGIAYIWHACPDAYSRSSTLSSGSYGMSVCLFRRGVY